MSGTEEPSPPDLVDLIAELEYLVESVGDERLRTRVEETIETARAVRQPAVFGRVIRGFDRADVAEALLGSLVFGIPMIIEGGTLEVGAFIADRPAFLVGTVLLGVVIVYGIIYVADIQQVEVVRPIFGLIPRRFAGVLAVAFGTALLPMTAWGRVDWAQPRLAIAQVSVVFVGMAIGAALGDILPGS